MPKISLGDGIIAGSNLTIGKISELALKAFSYLLHHYVPRGFYDILFKYILPAWRFKQWIVYNEIFSVFPSPSDMSICLSERLESDVVVTF